MAANNKANVSTTRGVVGGYFFSAPLGTVDVPTALNFANWTPGSSWENQGYVPEDGFTESVSQDGNDELRDINLDVVDSLDGSYTETLSIGFMEIAKNPLSTQYGHANVTDANGVIAVKHKWSTASESRMYALLLVLKDGRRWVKFIPSGKVTEIDDLTGNKTTVATRNVTITYATDNNGTGCYDWIQSNETPAPQLATLTVTGTGISLSPAFAAATTAYTSAATGTTATVTATSSDGTVAISDGNGNSYSSGSAVPLVAGTNKVTVTVTNNDGYTNAYTITITKS